MIRDKNGNTVLHLAVIYSRVEMLRFIVQSIVFVANLPTESLEKHINEATASSSSSNNGNTNKTPDGQAGPLLLRGLGALQKHDVEADTGATAMSPGSTTRTNAAGTSTTRTNHS